MTVERREDDRHNKEARHRHNKEARHRQEAGGAARPRRSRPLAGGRDRGYVLPLVALLLVGLMLFAGFAVDLGSWYAYAARAQRAADAAALAGATYLPDLSQARAAARDVAADNGFPDNAEIDVNVEQVATQQLRVTIYDRRIDQFFTSLVTDRVEVSRSAVAEYILPVTMGSPRNFLGTGNDPADALPTSLHENFWLAISGPCASRENGDLLSTVSDQNYYYAGNPTANPGAPGGTINWNRCTGSSGNGSTSTNPDFDAAGYFYSIDVPQGAVGQVVRVDAYDLPHCTASTQTDFGNSASDRPFNTRVRLRGPDSTPYEPADNPPIGSELAFSSGTNSGVCANDGNLTSGGWGRKWRQAFSFTATQAGRYFVQVRTDRNNSGTHRHGSNGFAFRVRTTSSWNRDSSPCSRDFTETIHRTDCVTISAQEYMGVYANLDGTFPSFYLAEIGPEHSGKTMVINLFDPGEGAQALEILDPLARSLPFSWRVIDEGADVTPTGGWSGTVTQPGGVPCSSAPPNCNELDVLGNPGPGGTGDSSYWRGWNPQRGPYFGSRSKYSDRKLEIRVQLPADIRAAYGGRTWWRVRYHMPPAGLGAATDRTTWSVVVTGDPVRLIN
ncbi:MAG: hypothetical protein KatS3mg008_2015 [Acidimicrobiales bacterium]|nr:MAG: hypothetical protein KatS3mg008_2015 [Acidimicrobiales bacterium]